MRILFYADVSALDLRSPAIPLSAYRQERLQRVKSPLAKRQSLGAELLLQQALRVYAPEWKLPPEIAVKEDGKPYFPGQELYFSLSHSESIALCALSDREIGADVQQERPYNRNLARRFFTEAEQAYISGVEDPAYAFTQVWALKESYIKAVGKGLKTPLPSFSVAVDGFSSEGCGDHSFWHCCRDGFHFGVCVKGGSAAPDFFEKIVL